MHHVAEEGIAAHWKYKEGKAFDPKKDSQFGWLRQLLEHKSSEDIVESLKDDVLTSQIYVFTPSGDVQELPIGSTPIDFAYSIHSEIGNKCVGAKVNGRIVHLKYRLQNGDKVEIITNPTQEPRKDWLSFAKTSRAKERIRAFLRKKDGEKARHRGTELIERELKEHDVSFREVFENQTQLKKLLDKLNERSLDELLTSVGFGMLSPRKVVHILFPSDKYKDDEEALSSVVEEQQVHSDPFHIKGVEDMMIKIAKCCTPLPGDDVVGYISNGRGIIVHKRDCTNVKNAAVHKDRLIEVSWDSSVNYTMPVKFMASTENRPGVINGITSVVGGMELNIVEYSAHSLGGGASEQRFSVELHNKDQLETLLTKLRQVKGVKDIWQVT
jgi:GTP pyrophosphokinase